MISRPGTTDPLLDENEVADFTGASLTTVRRWRREGRGPAYRKIGRLVRYKRDDLADWVGAARRLSTAQAS